MSTAMMARLASALDVKSCRFRSVARPEAWVAHVGIDTPEQEDVGAVADLAERRAGAAAFLRRQQR